MNHKKGLVIVVLTFVLLLVGASVLYNRLSGEVEPDQLTQQETPGSTQSSDHSEEAVPEKISAPDFTVYDREGNAVQLSDYFGKPIVLNFWASWCGPCKMEMPDFQDQYLELGEEIHFLMINVTDGSRETVESASAFIEEQGYTFPVFYDTDSDAALTYGAYALPTTYFIDAEGFAAVQATGAINGETLRRGIDIITK